MIKINSKEYKCRSGMVLKKILEGNDMLIPGIIVVVDEKLIPPSEYGKLKIEDTQKIEITHVVGGG
jgi:thiamine biosynthesis protein ThiS